MDIVKERRDGSTDIRQTLNQNCYKRLKRLVYNDKGVNIPRCYNNYKIYLPNIKASNIQCKHKQVEDRNGQITIIRDFNISLSKLNRTTRRKIDKEPED